MSAPAPTRAGGEPPSRPHALVVDDEPRLVRLVSAYLEREGFSVSTAADGEDAIRRAHERPPDVVVLDLMLPGIDGIEVCRRIRTFSDAYIVMLSARAEEVDTIVGLSTGGRRLRDQAVLARRAGGAHPGDAPTTRARGRRSRRPGGWETW